MEVNDINEKRKQCMWLPLWKNQVARPLTALEKDSLNRISLALNIRREYIEPVITVSGEKSLRVKLYKGVEHSVERFDYYFFGPLVIKNNKLCYKLKQVIPANGQDQTESTVHFLLEEEALIDYINEAINKKSA